MQSIKTLVSIRNLVQRYGRLDVLKNISMDIEDGEFLTVLGPSGSGKTSILRILGGFAEPTSGDILLDGRNIVGTPAAQRPFNTVFQDYALFPHLTVAENIEFGLKVRRIPADKRKAAVASSLEMVSLVSFAQRYPHQLSGGQRQRVALARALVCKPRIVLLDEPLSALDAELRKQMQQFLKAIQRDVRTTFVFVTHDQDEALNISDRICVINEGHIEQLDSPEIIYRRPATEFVARFFGENNFIPVAPAGGNELDSPIGRLEASISTTHLQSEGLLAIRPEAITLSPTQQAGGNARVGRVETVEFSGSTIKLTVRVEAQSLALRTPSSTPNLPSVGENTMISWRSQDTWFVPKGRST